jgi:hypothetical protein
MDLERSKPNQIEPDRQPGNTAPDKTQTQAQTQAQT